MPVATAEAGVTESFLNRLSQRAGHKLRQPVQFSDHKLRQPVLFANANGQVATLRPWAAPIAAPQISQTLLKSLAAERQLGNPQLNTGQPKNGAAKERASLADQRSNNDHQLNSARAFRFQPLTQSPPAAWAGERPATNRFLKDSTLPSPSGNGETAEALAGALSPNSSAALAPELPPMLPPSDIGVPILPLAASSAQHGARGEAVAIEDDLDALAAKIKLILDEQARRYGIDV